MTDDQIALVDVGQRVTFESHHVARVLDLIGHLRSSAILGILSVPPAQARALIACA